MGATNKLISIMMPAWKVESHRPLFSEALRGIVQQTYSNWELIIACDGGGAKTIKYATKRGGCCLSNEFLNGQTKIKWKCKHKHEWEARFSSMRHRNNWCPYCSKKAKKTIKDCIDTAIKMGGMCLSDIYINCQTKLKWKCKFGHEWEANYSSVLNSGSWCPDCSAFKTQRSLSGLISNILNTTAHNNYSGFDWLKTEGGRMQIDIWITEYKLAVEYDGEQHFRPVNFGGISDKRAKENLKYTIIMDSKKNKAIKEHPEDVKYFIRFSYKDRINKENVKRILIENGVLCGV